MCIPFEANKALQVIEEQLAKSLVAVYLHGSAVAGGLRPRSDVDLLVVIDQSMTFEARECLAAELMKISGRYPFDPNGRRPLELIVFLRDDLAASLYPMRCEFIYGEWLRHEYESKKIPDSIHDSEFTLLLAQARQEAKSLVGPGASELLPVISDEDIRKAIGDALPALIATLDGDERNVLLTLARMWRTITTGEFVTKDAAATWAATRLPAEQAAMLIEARNAYLGVRQDHWRNRQQEILQTVSLLRDYVVANL